MARKGENIYKRKDGRWEGRYIAGKSPEGKTLYRSVYGKAYREVKEKLLEKKREILLSGDGEGALPAGLTIRESVYLWLEENSGKWKVSTFSTYRSIMEKHIIPGLGQLAAKSFVREDWNGYFNRLCSPSASVQGKKFSDSYLRQISLLFGQVLHFLENKYHCSGLARHVAVIPVKAKAMQTPEGKDLQRLGNYAEMEARKGDLTSLGVLLSGCSGIRIGELCALKWKDIDFENGILLIRKTMQRIRTFPEPDINRDKQGQTGTKIIIASPKSQNSIREIPLPESLLGLLESAKAKAGATEETYVLQGKRKEYTEPRTLQYRFRRLLETLAIPAFNFHMLRHIFATNCIAQGFDMKTLSELLGHANVGITMRIYVHSDMERKKQLMAGYKLAA